ncbi:selenocysteine-specific translation elongation factor, partial [Enterobacteriaceae bacterium LUAb1]
MIIVTAGHVDHGKTALLQALTGQCADRLPEEKKRGMTIDLGYAYWPQPDGRVLGFIDVPGHEKFLANMLSGISGVDHALLVVACDDGVMPQTREHLQLLQLSGQPTLTVALSKADRVSTARVQTVQQQVTALALTLGWKNPAFFATSIIQPATVTALAQHLLTLHPSPRTEGKCLRLAVDRVFLLKGAGVVVTGTVHTGEIKQGDLLWLTGSGKPVRVRSLHVQNQPALHGYAGQRVAVNLAGDIEKNDITRGDWLLDMVPPDPVQRVLVALTPLHVLHNAQSVHIYHAARHITGRLLLLNTHLAELVLDAPLWLADNDTLILRDACARITLAGCRVISLFPPRRGKRQDAYLTWLTSLAAAIHDDVTALTLLLSRGPCQRRTLCWARQLDEQTLGNLLAPQSPLQAGEWLLAASLAANWQQVLIDTLTQWHNRHPDERGVGRARLGRMALPGQPESLVQALTDSLLKQRQLVNHHGLLHLPEFVLQFDATEYALWLKVEAVFNDDAWWVRDIALALQCEEETTRNLLRKAGRLGYLTAIVNDRYYRTSRVQIFASLIRKRAGEGYATSAADFRDQLG